MYCRTVWEVNFSEGLSLSRLACGQVCGGIISIVLVGQDDRPTLMGSILCAGGQLMVDVICSFSQAAAAVGFLLWWNILAIDLKQTFSL